MQNTWQVTDAKNRFSELVELSLQQGPQTITKHGKPVAQIVPISTAADRSYPATDADQFTDFLLATPKLNLALEQAARQNRKAPPDLGT
jgi:antitoxin Phd